MTQTKIKKGAEFEHRTDNILESNAYVLVNPVNCVGVMGKGLAAAFKRKYPAMFRHYKTYCQMNCLEPGGYFYYEVVNPQTPTRHILNVATKNHWSDPSSLVWIEDCAEKIRYLTAYSFLYSYKLLVAQYPDLPPRPEIAIPALGCGEGGLQYSDVLPILERKLCDVPAKFVLYPPK